MRKLFFSISLLLLLGSGMFAQGSYQVAMIARTAIDSVQIRWAPSDPLLWKQLRDTGVYLVRHTVMRDGQLLPISERQKATLLTSTPLYPRTLAAFEAAAPRDNYIAIAGQAIHGESFLVEQAGAGEQLINSAKELQNRFSFGLFAADQSWDAALMSALAFTDYQVVPNETYVYRMRPAGNIASLDTLNSCFVSIDVANDAPPPKVSQLEYEFGDRGVAIKWNYELLGSYYTSYNIERSEDGLSWTQVNELPFVPLTEPGQPLLALYQADFLENNRPYFFRVSGRTPFGTTGPASDPIQGMGKDPALVAAPSIRSVFPSEEGGFEIGWAFATETTIQGFKVFRSDKDRGQYEAISDLLPPETRSYRDPAPLVSNYYEVRVYDQYGRELKSFSALAQLDDITPPITPRNLRGLILEDGQVIINWDKNEEDDLLGYRVWFANDREAEFSLATGAPITHNFFIDQTTLNTNSKEMFVKVSALDYRHNRSPLSDYVVLMRPDTIPPSAPLLSNLEATTENLTLSFRLSQTPDVQMHELFRRQAGDTTWQQVARYEQNDLPAQLAYTDTELSKGTTYEYRMEAVDWSGLRSTSKVLQGGVVDNFVRQAVAKVRATTDRRERSITLSWQYAADDPGLQYFEIYRARPGQAPRIIDHLQLEESTEKIEDPTQRQAYQFTDAGPLRMNTNYTYQVRAVYRNGGQSPLSPVCEVNY